MVSKIQLTNKQREAVEICVRRFQRGEKYSAVAGYA